MTPKNMQKCVTNKETTAGSVKDLCSPGMSRFSEESGQHQHGRGMNYSL